MAQHGEIKAGCRHSIQGDPGRVQAERASVDGLLWGFWAKAGSVSSNQKEQGFDKLCRGFV